MPTAFTIDRQAYEHHRKISGKWDKIYRTISDNFLNKCDFHFLQNTTIYLQSMKMWWEIQLLLIQLRFHKIDRQTSNSHISPTYHEKWENLDILG